MLEISLVQKSDAVKPDGCSMKGKTIIVFAPHPDDETIGCGGTIAKRVDEGCQVYVVVLTDGRHAFSRVLKNLTSPSPQELVYIRKREVREALAILGVPENNLFFFDFEDCTLSEQEKKAEKMVEAFIASHRPDEIYLPFKRDAHPDHQAAHKIVNRCLHDNKLRAKTLQYSITHKLSRVGPLIERGVGLLTDRIQEEDISEYLWLKKRAVQEYRSEIQLLSKDQKRPIVENVGSHLKSKERFFV